MRNNPESDVVIEEMHLTMARMRIDAGRPPLTNRTMGSRFAENFEKIASDLELPSSDNNFLRPYTYLLIPGYFLFALKMPEIIAFFRRRDKHSPFPQEPQTFFSQVQNPPEWAQRQFGFRREGITAAENVFRNLTAAMDGKTPLLWNFVELTEVIRFGLGVVGNPGKYKKIIMEAYRESSSQESFHIFQALGDTVFLHDMLKFYIHPGTLDLLNNLMKEEDGILMGPEEGMRPPAITRFQEDIIVHLGPVVRALIVGDTSSQ